ncbi:alkaline ceramidase TOD1-like [Salvia miltiorrhiza]|uniref:alkaline ceramidase TOD1-like n=1 Tax=Salvia miltiorrhiza TaxID=226208 RepID=UPI0025AD3752|nr:alkaline ceramidase TOD1-like [Salvia miltiorrhiza]
MEKPTTCTLLLQSKLLCFSLIYVLSAVYLSLSSTKCLIRPPSAAPPPFSYPPSYGENKHAIPTMRSSCNSPVFFSDYSVVLKKMEMNSENATIFGERSLRYMQENDESFGGNLSLKKRLSHFVQSDYGDEIPCGFFKPFPISNSDQIAMEKCNGVVVVTAIFNDHDKIRQPRNLRPKTWNHVCFFVFVDDATIKGLYSHNLMSRDTKESKIGVWRVVRVRSEDLYDNPAMNGVIPKHLLHRLFPNTKYSIWVDAKLQLMIDPLLLIDALVVGPNVDMALSRHPHFVHTMEEAMATARWKKWRDVDGLRVQMETYCENGLQPWHSNKSYPTDVPDSAVMVRKHNAATNHFSCLLFNELEAFNHRDQLPFAFVRDKMTPKLRLNMFEVEVFEQIAVEYRHNLKQGGTHVGPKLKWATPALFGHQCEGYFSEMLGQKLHY